MTTTLFCCVWSNPPPSRGPSYLYFFHCNIMYERHTSILALKVAIEHNLLTQNCGTLMYFIGDRVEKKNTIMPIHKYPHTHLKRLM